MQRPVLIGSISAGTDSTQWAVRLGEDTWTEADRKEGQARGCTVNGGVPGGWWGWGAKASGPLYRGEVARSGAGLPPGASMLGHTTKTDKEVEQFNAIYIKQNPVYRPDCCEDYACSLIGWLLGAGYLLETLLHFTNSAGAPEDSLQHEFEIHEELIESTDSDESEEDEKIEEEDGNYKVAKDRDLNLETLQCLIVDADDDSEEDDPTYIPPHERSNHNEYTGSVLPDEDDTESLKRKSVCSELEDEDESKVMVKKLKPSVDKYTEEGHSEKEEGEKYVHDQEEGGENEEEEEVYEDEGDMNEEEDDVCEEGGDVNEEDEDIYGEEEVVYEGEGDITTHTHNKYDSAPTEANPSSTGKESWSSGEEEDSEDENEDKTYDTTKKEKNIDDDDESGYSTHDQSMEILNTPAA